MVTIAKMDETSEFTSPGDVARTTPARTTGPYRTRNTFVGLKAPGPYEAHGNAPIVNSINETSDLIGPRCVAAGLDVSMSSQNVLVGKAFFEKIEKSNSNQHQALSNGSTRPSSHRESSVVGALDSIDKIERVLFDWNLDPKSEFESNQFKNAKNLSSSDRSRNESSEDPSTPPQSSIAHSDEDLKSVYAEFYAQALLQVEDRGLNRSQSPILPFAYSPDFFFQESNDVEEAHDTVCHVKDAEEDYAMEDSIFQHPVPNYKAGDATVDQREEKHVNGFTDDEEVNSVLAEFLAKSLSHLHQAVMDDAEVTDLVVDIMFSRNSIESQVERKIAELVPRLSSVGEIDPATGELILEEPCDQEDVDLILQLLTPTFSNFTIQAVR